MNLKKVSLIGLFILTSLSLITVRGENTTSDSISKLQHKLRAQVDYGQMFRKGDFIVTSPYHTIQIGLMDEIELKYGLGVETGLKYGYAFGKREQLYNNLDTAFFNYSAHFINIPIRVTFTLPIFWGMKIFAYAGPNFNIGLAQKSTTNFTKKKEDIPNFPALPLPVSGTYDLYQTELKRFSFQIGTGGGIQWKQLRIRSGYDWGLNNIAKDKLYPQKIRGWNVAFEYKF
jgi:hypothetical protein